MKRSMKGGVNEIHGGFMMCKIFLRAVLLAPLLIGSAIADDQSAARAILDEAIKAHGGKAALSKVVGIYEKSKLSQYNRYNPSPTWTIESGYYQGNGKERSVSSDWNNKVRTTFVVDGTQGWQKIFDAVQEMNDAQLKTWLANDSNWLRITVIVYRLSKAMLRGAVGKGC
jgi:hypothetical protein